MSGLTSTGFTPKTIEEIRQEVIDEARATIDPTLDLSATEPLGQVVAICSQREALMWELLATAFGAFDPEAAENFLADNLAAITGTKRLPATPSLVQETCNVNAGFTALAGTVQVNVSGDADAKFVNRDDIPSQTAGDHVFPFVSVDNGPVVANSGTLTVISAPVAGLNTVTNVEDAVLGTFDESDSDLMTRREQELAAPGSCTVDATRADVLQEVKGVKQCFVFENVTMATDGNGLPPKSSEVVVFDGLTPAALNADVAKVVWNSKPSGSETYGTITMTVKDSQGEDRTVKWSRATVKALYLDFDLLVDPEHFPADGVNTVKSTVARACDGFLNLGVDVVAARMKAFALTVAGVIDVPAVRLGFTASPTGLVNLPISGREIANADTSRIGVTTTNGVP